MISIKNAAHYKWGQGCDGWHLVKSSALSVIQERVPPGCSESRHFHENAEQFFFVLSGLATIEVNSNVYILGKNEGIHVPAEVPHQLKNEHSQDLVFTVTSTPASHGDRIELGPL